jgi:geranylgeranyl diphosphate synthase type II
LEGAIHHFDRLVVAAIEAIPPCPGAEQMRALVRFEAERLVPKAIAEEVIRVAA